MAVTCTSITDHHLIVKGAKIVYEPSVYNGTGAEIRKNLLLAVDQTIRDQLTAIETQIHLGPTLCSVVKPETIRVKIDTDQVRLFDADHHQIQPAREVGSQQCGGTLKRSAGNGARLPMRGLAFAAQTSASRRTQASPRSGKPFSHTSPPPIIASAKRRRRGVHKRRKRQLRWTHPGLRHRQVASALANCATRSHCL